MVAQERGSGVVHRGAEQVREEHRALADLVGI
jgi:hypothetical protein